MFTFYFNGVYRCYKNFLTCNVFYVSNIVLVYLDKYIDTIGTEYLPVIIEYF